ncbi:LppX_LprAFG lipoprotein [Actinokineospora sp. NBRC 105648]|uniref:LppX_LprAFG lipoprotein n=1 Tax=Actinokineospora sp. NBRC 105648 TaxID=3032206 RepID=UPI0024A606AF|nr:LppX_LprAFG lipoprotein [Actinokineospora sp. NBRC 105648]GLZ43540.1 lipoarabinomannan carrier protein LprG [Actinokineospora sp. NBRC 105648]
MVKRGWVLGILALVAALATGCTSDESPPGPGSNLPDGAALLRDSSATTKNIKSAHFTLKVNGSVAAIPVQNAEGDLTREGGASGAAKGTVKLTLMGQLIEGEFVLVDDSLYIKGPTGGFQKFPSALTSNIYDPSAILNPDKGIANVLAKIQNPRTEAKESVDGVSAYKVSGKVTKDVVSGIVPGVSSDVDVSIWVREDNKQPAKASVALPGGAGKSATVDLTLSDVDKPVSITAP